MSENHSNGSYGILPSFVMDNDDLDEGAKVLYARISLLSQEGRCWASNEYFAQKQKVSSRCIQKWLKQLVDAECITIDCERIPGKGTLRNIWLIIDFKKMYTKRTTVHPPPRTTVHPPTNYSSCHIQITETNNRDILRKAHGSHVKLSDQEYESLCKKETKSRVDEIIQEINDHCVNNRPKGYEDYTAAFRTFLRNQNKTKGKTNGTYNQRKSSQKSIIQTGGEFVNGKPVQSPHPRRKDSG